MLVTAASREGNYIPDNVTLVSVRCEPRKWQYSLDDVDTGNAERAIAFNSQLVLFVPSIGVAGWLKFKVVVAK
jgi:hypothetical protein